MTDDERLAALRLEMRLCDKGELNAYVVPSADAHQSEYVSDCDMRRAFISGFDGSAGLALVTVTEALLWTDGRYYLQASIQLSNNWQLMKQSLDPPVEDWIAQNLPSRSRVGIDATCLSVQASKSFENALKHVGIELILVESNLVDKIWDARPAAPRSPIAVHPEVFCGRSVPDKLEKVREKMKEVDASTLLVTALDEVAWLFNVRGSDIPYNPVVKSYAIVTVEDALLFVDPEKVTVEAKSHFDENKIEVLWYENILLVLDAIAKGKASIREADEASRALPHVWIDPKTCNLAILNCLRRHLSDNSILEKPSPILIPKAVKSEAELSGMKESHLRDAAAMVSFLSWLDKKVQTQLSAEGYFQKWVNLSPKKPGKELKLDEISVAAKLESFRASQKHFVGLSFPTISSVGSNAAIIHYKPEPGKCRDLSPQEMYLFDSGAQYLDGTTDVTRTVHFGSPSDHERDCFTRVLKGHISLGSAVFPNGTTGIYLDTLARLSLWKSGLDYGHGTGHGVGSYLNVHEGPHLISFRSRPDDVALMANMVVTNEPGYYEEGNFGIRIENVMLVKDAKTEHNFASKGYLEFEPLTWVPIQTKLINCSLLTEEERDWVNNYHKQCFDRISPLLSKDEASWLMKATAPLPR